jgi:hypothetical protein
MRQLVSGVDGRAFIRLNAHPDYAAQYEAGYTIGRIDGSDYALKQWYDAYTDVLKTMANGLLALAGDVTLQTELFVATVDELLVRHDPGGAALSQDPRYLDLIARLRGPAAAGPAREAVQPAVPAAVDEEAIEMLEAAAYADGMQRLCRQFAEPARYHPVDFLYNVADLTVADWLSELDASVSNVVAHTLELNCQPFDQGYYVGSWTSQAVVNTLRKSVEFLLRTLIPPLLIPGAKGEVLPYLPFTADIAVNAILAGTALEDEDD